MKIALISHSYPTLKAPFFTKFIKDQAEILTRDLKIEVQVFVPTPYSVPFTKKWRFNNSDLLLGNFSGKRVHYLSFPEKRFPKLIQKNISRSILFELNNDVYDLIHIHWLYPCGLAIQSLKRLDCPVVITIHGSDWYKNIDNKNLMSLLKVSLQKADWVFFVGPDMRSDAIKTFNFLENKSSYLPNSVDGKFYSYGSPKRKEKLRQRFGWSNDKTHFICAASHRPEKGVDLLIEAAKQVYHINSSVHFHIIGSRDSQSADIDYSNTQNVSFYEPVSPEKLLNYFHAADFYVSPSRKEGFGLAMIEAAATGLPLVATCAGIAPYFISSKIGYLCDKITTESITNNILKATQNATEFNSEYIRKKALEKFNRGAFANRIYAKYQELLNCS